MPSPAEFHYADFVESIPDLPEGEEFIIFGTVYAHPEHADALEALYANTNEHAKSEPGTLQYYLARDDEDRNVFHMFEQYASPKAFKEHNSRPVTAEIMKCIKGVKARFVKPNKVAPARI